MMMTMALLPGPSKTFYPTISVSITRKSDEDHQTQMPSTVSEMQSAISNGQTHQQQWSEKDQRLLETLQRCRARLAEQKNSNPKDSSISKVSTFTSYQQLKREQKQLRNEKKLRRKFSSCPQFSVIAESAQHVQFESQNERKFVKPKEKNNENVIDESKNNTSLESAESNGLWVGHCFTPLKARLGSDKQSIKLQFPLQFEKATPRRHGYDKIEPLSRAATLFQSIDFNRKKEERLEEPIESSPLSSPASVDIVIPTAGSLSDTSSHPDGPSSLSTSTKNSNRSPNASKSPRKQLVRVSARIQDVSPSVSSTAHVLLTTKLKKKTYSFPDVRNDSKVANNCKMTGRSSKSSSGTFSLPNISNEGRKYNHFRVETASPDATKSFVSESVVTSNESGGTRSITTPPTISTVPTPESGRKFVQTTDGVYVLNILKSQTPSSVATMLTNETAYYNSYRPNTVHDNARKTLK